MTTKITPAIVIKSKYVSFATSKGKTSFTNYVNYIDRKETQNKENKFESYHDYMANEEKSTGIFTNTEDSISRSEKEKIKSIFQNAQKKQGVMWQDVISFDNDWLKEVGILKTNNDGSQFIDELKMKQATRAAVNNMWAKEGQADSYFWTAAIHYNTDNIHIHVATVQTKDFRTRGKRKFASIGKLKSVMANALNDRSKENEKLNDFIRNKIVKSKRENSVVTLKSRVLNPEMVKQFKKIHAQLPADKRTWQYNMNALKEIRPEIDKLTEQHINKYYPNEFKDFKKQLDNEVAHYKRTYGDTKNVELYRETKMKDLYTRCGNTILKEMKSYDKQLNEISKRKMRNSYHANFQMNRAANTMLYRVSRLMSNNFEHHKNQREFEKLQHEQELNR